MRATDRTIRVAPQPQLPERHVQSIVEKQPVLQCRADPEQDLHRFGGLNQADKSGQDAEYAAFSATRNQSRRRWLRIKAAIARTVLICEHSCLPLEAKD